MMLNENYVPLWVKSNFSFLEGASHPEELVAQAHSLGLAGMAITDRHGVYGAVRAHVKAQELGLPLLVGTEIWPTQAKTPVIALAQTRQGYGHLCRFLSYGQQQPTANKGEAKVEWDDLFHLATADGRRESELILLLPPGHAHETMPRLKSAWKDRLYALLVRHEQEHEVTLEHTQLQQARIHQVPVVAATEVLYHHPKRRPLQDVMRCIQHGTTLEQAAGRYLQSNDGHSLLSAAAMQARFGCHSNNPALAAALARTLEVAQRCTFSFASIRYRYPSECLPEGKTETQWLHELTWEGARHRYGQHGISDAVLKQLEHELALIHQLDYVGYFLTMWEIVQFCKRSHILCQGRGSAANSAVCYCLGITAIDPIEMDLLFERFISAERAEPPDIDLDIEHSRREEVIQWVYHRYGRRYAAMVANVIRYRTRSAIRDVGKAMGLPLTQLDRLAKMSGHLDEEGLTANKLRDAGLDPACPLHAHMVARVQEIKDFPRHLSIHPGGFLLGHEPVDTLVPIEPGTMDDRTVIQWDKYDVESLGLFKVDLLGLGALTHIHQCFDLMASHGLHEAEPLTMATVPRDDPDTYAMITKGDTAGVFQIESRAQMAMLPRLKPKTFYDLVIEVAIVRPGPIQGDMVHPYLARRAGTEPVEYPHPSLKKVLAKTLGVPIFQEQVMKLAVQAAGYTPGEADQLRRDMGAWRASGRIERHRDRLISRMKAHGIPESFAQRVFSQIRGFGEYGFPESHAASFAKIAYVTAWLKCHHHAAFTCALLNAQPMGFYRPSTLIDDAKRHEVTVLPVSIQHSAWDCTLEPQTATSAANEHSRGHNHSHSHSHSHSHAVRIGLRYVRGLTQRDRELLEQEPSPPYQDLPTMVRQTKLATPALVALTKAGAFDDFGDNRRQVLWQVRALAATAQDGLAYPAKTSRRSAEQLELNFADLNPSEQVAWDYMATDLSPRGHPLTPHRVTLQAQGYLSAKALREIPDGCIVRCAGLVLGRQRPQTASGVTFYTLEDETGWINLVVWKQVFNRYAVVAKTATVLGVSGKVQAQDGVIHVIAQTLWAWPASENL